MRKLGKKGKSYNTIHKKKYLYICTFAINILFFLFSALKFFLNSKFLIKKKTFFNQIQFQTPSKILKVFQKKDPKLFLSDSFFFKIPNPYFFISKKEQFYFLQKDRYLGFLQIFFLQKLFIIKKSVYIKKKRKLWKKEKKQSLILFNFYKSFLRKKKFKNLRKFKKSLIFLKNFRKGQFKYPKNDKRVKNFTNISYVLWRNKLNFNFSYFRYNRFKRRIISNIVPNLLNILKMRVLRARKLIKNPNVIQKKKKFNLTFKIKKNKLIRGLKKRPIKFVYIVRNKKSVNFKNLRVLSRFEKLFKKRNVFRKKQFSIYPFLKKLQKNYNVLKSHLLTRQYFLIFKKKRNNFYFSVINHKGEVIQSISSGYFSKLTYNKRNKKLRSSFFTFNLIIKNICSKLKKKKIYRINTFFKPTILKNYIIKKIVRRFLISGVKIMKVKVPLKYSHSSFKKNKKIRRL